MIYELIATDIDVKSCEAKCENKGGILPQDFGMLTVDDIYISGTTSYFRNEITLTVLTDDTMPRSSDSYR